MVITCEVDVVCSVLHIHVPMMDLCASMELGNVNLFVMGQPYFSVIYANNPKFTKCVYSPPDDVVDSGELIYGKYILIYPHIYVPKTWHIYGMWWAYLFLAHI